MAAFTEMDKIPAQPVVTNTVRTVALNKDCGHTIWNTGILADGSVAAETDVLLIGVAVPRRTAPTPALTEGLGQQICAPGQPVHLPSGLSSVKLKMQTAVSMIVDISPTEPHLNVR